MSFNAFRKRIGAAIAALALGGLSASAATLELKLVYAGHTTGNNPNTLTGTSADLTNPAFQVPTERHYFDVFAKLNGVTGEDFRAVIFDITLGAGINKIDNLGNAAGTNKWFANNPNSPNIENNITFSPTTTFNVNSDAATAGDLLGVTVQQSNNAFANQTQALEPGAEAGGIGFNATLQGSRLGRFAIQFPSALPSQTTVSVNMQTGNNFSFFSGNQAGAGTFTTQATGVTGGAVAIAVPEPGTFGVLLTAAGGMLLSRRRRLPA